MSGLQHCIPVLLTITNTSGPDESNTNDFAKFITAFLVASGIALPLVLYHTRLVVLPATIMSTSGGLLIYTSIIVFTLFFQDSEDEF